MKKQALIKTAVLLTMITMAGTAFASDSNVKRNRTSTMNSNSYSQPCTQNWSKLTDEQRNKLNTLRQKFTDETATARASIVSKREEIRILMETSSPDKAKLKALSNDLTELEKQVAVKEIDMSLEAKKIAPELNMPMGFLGAGKHGMMGNGGMGGNGISMMGGKGMGMMMGKGMGKMNSQANDTLSQDKEVLPNYNDDKSI